MSKLIKSLSRVMDSSTSDIEYLYSKLESLVNSNPDLKDVCVVDKMSDSVRLYLVGYPYSYVQVYPDNGKVVVDKSRNAEKRYSYVRNLAKDLSIPEEEAEAKVDKFFSLVDTLMNHSNGTVEDIAKLKIGDSAEDDLESLIKELEGLKPFAPEVKGLVKKIYDLKPEGHESVKGSDGKELVAFAHYNSDNGEIPVYSFKQRAWEKLEDSATTTMQDVNADIPGTIKEKDPVDDSVDENGFVFFGKEDLLRNVPIWVADKDLFNMAVDMATKEGTVEVRPSTVLLVYKKLGGTITGKTSDSFFRDIVPGDNLLIIRPDEYRNTPATVLSESEDGIFHCKDLRDNKEFDVPKNQLYGLALTVTDSIDSSLSLREFVLKLSNVEDPVDRVDVLKSKVVTTLNEKGLDVEVDDSGNIWLNNDDIKIQMDDKNIYIYAEGSDDPEVYSITEDTEKWLNRIVELSIV